MSRVFPSLLALAFLTLAADAQDLAGTWLRVKLSARLVVDDAPDTIGGPISPAFTNDTSIEKVSEVFYVELLGPTGIDQYALRVVHDAGEGWSVAPTSGLLQLAAPGIVEEFDVSLPVATDDGGGGFIALSRLSVVVNGRVVVKTDGDGAVKRVRIRAAGAFVEAEDTGALADAAGGARLRARSIDPAKLPFDPELLED